MKTCFQCGRKLNQGNSVRVLVPGRKKRSLVCRAWPKCGPAAAAEKKTVAKWEGEARTAAKANSRKTVEAKTLTTVADFVNAPGKAQGGQGGAVTLQGVLDYRPPARTRFFIRPAMAEKIRRAVGKPLSAFGITVEIIPVPADQVEAFPEQFQELIEVEMNIKGVDL